MTSAYVDFFIDDIYMGTNNAFVPTRGSRLSIALWGAGYVTVTTRAACTV